MRIIAHVTYRCFTCGEMITNEDGTPNIEDVIFVNSEGELVEPPFPGDTTTHHAYHSEE